MIDEPLVEIAHRLLH